MFNISETLKETEDAMGIIYKDNIYCIRYVANWSLNHELYFSITKKIDDTNQFCRISITEANYIGAEGEDLILNEIEKMMLNNILSSKLIIPNQINATQPEDNTIWKGMIFQLNFEHEYCDTEEFIWKELPLDLPIPDYTKLP